MEARIDDLLPRLTLEEKINLIGGGAYMQTHAVSRLGIPEFRMTDGPFGVRAGPSRVYACGLALAASWDIDQARKVGVALGRDCRARGINILLAPGMNLYRAPFSGRNFEYFGEDPLLTGELGCAYIQGVQSQGVAATMKHFVANEQEFNRRGLNSEVDERTLRELYLKPFEMAVKKAGVWCAMDSYNPLNGTHTTESDWLNNQVLKGEWEFKGLVMSDWKAAVSTLATANGGLDLEMPSPKFLNSQALQPLINAGQVTQATLDDKVRRIFRVVFSMGWMDRPQLDNSIPKDDPQNDQVALDGAREGIVLLKNSGNILPLNPMNVKKVVVLGPNADPAVAVGGGSAHANYTHAVSVFQGLKDVAGPNVDVIRVPWSILPTGTDIAAPGKTPLASTTYGAEGNPPFPPASIDDIKSADVAVICVGYNGQSARTGPDWEGEDKDRAYDLPPGQVAMIEAVVKLNPHTVVILNAGGSVATAGWIGDVPVLLDAFYPGQAGGTALAEILFGKVNPSGKLPFSWEKRWEDCAAYGNFPTEASKGNDYKEGVFLGYRWFDRKGIEPLFPFGFGLSYTTFAYSNLELQSSPSGDFTATFTVQNNGTVPGAEIAQLYVAPPSTGVPRPMHELKGFVRTALQPGESKQVGITVAREDLGYWDPATKKWTVTPGQYQIEVGSSSRDLGLKGSVTQVEKPN
ncbi:MAG: glycoside hydrolase family 3 C-terminal domain-containing protein [Methylacidiphilales bacterium]|nr:glycoside hydrolase family 3 C-terminal domain-containing protein [Candidatus Methylacidiphilales bacterium]